MHQKHTSSIMVFHTSVLVTNPKLGGNETLGKKTFGRGWRSSYITVGPLNILQNYPPVFLLHEIHFSLLVLLCSASTIRHIIPSRAFHVEK